MAGLAAVGLAGLLGLAGARGGAGAGGGAGAPGRVRLHLAPRDPGALHAHARAVQAGGRPAGGAAAREALRGLSAPREGAEARARAWAGALGGRVAAASPHGDFLDVELPRAAAEALSEGGAGQGRAVPGQALSAGKLPAPLAEDVLSARWVAVPRPAEGAAARGNDPRGRSQRALLQDDGDDGASSGNSTVAPSSVAALLLMGLNAAVPAGFLASKPREELLKNVKDLQSAPAIIVPCGVGVDPLTSGLTVQYHGTDGVECDFTVTASYEVWYGGAWEASEERTTPLTEFTQYRCGDLFADQSEEEAEASCRGWAQGITLALASQAGSIGGIAVQPAITADTSVFVYDLASNGLPTFAGVSGGRLAARVPDFDSADLPERELPVEDDDTYPGLWESIVQRIQCSDGSGADVCFTVDYKNDAESATEFMVLAQALPFPFFSSPVSLGATITPEYAKAAYGGANGTASGLGMSALFVGTYNFMSQDNLDEANEAFGLPSPEVVIYPGPYGPGNYPNQLISGASLSPSDCIDQLGESDLDVQMLSQYGPGADVGFIPSMTGLDPGIGTESDGSSLASNEAFNPCGSIENYIFVLQSNQDASPPKPLPKVLSLSWDALEAARFQARIDSQSASDDDGAYCEESLAKMVSMGVQLLVSSGDDGGTSPYSCNVVGAVGTSVLTPQYPASSPYVTSVGAIMDVRMAEGEDPVMAACMAPSGGLITSGGGFSVLYDRPEWQEEAVSEYLDRDHSGYKYYPGQGQTGFAPTGRGYPDVSFYGYNIPVITCDEISGFAGTSASAPMFGGLLLQLIARLEESGVCGGRDITFVQLNRFLYKAAKTHSAAFIDIVHGNIAWSSSTVNCGLGYEATEGWDPASGLGTVNWPEFVQAAIDMADEFFCDG